jgi:hypothetical protein
LLTFSFTLVPGCSRAPAFGFWLITRPFFTLAEYAFVILPTAQ